MVHLYRFLIRASPYRIWKYKGILTFKFKGKEKLKLFKTAFFHSFLLVFMLIVDVLLKSTLFEFKMNYTRRKGLTLKPRLDRNIHCMKTDEKLTS